MANDAGPEAKRWGLAATAVLTTLTRRVPRHDLLGGAEKNPENEATAKTILASSWSVDGRDKLVSTLEWLGSNGHSADYRKVAAAYAAAPPPQRQQDPALAFVNQYGSEIGDRGLLAWDLGRLLAVAGWGYLAGYCSEEEAFGAVLSAGVRLRAAYRSWDDYGRHYRLGALFWDANAVGQIDAILAQLASAPDSPWRAVPWNLDGAGASAIAAAAPSGVMGGPPPTAASYGAPPAVGSPGGAPPGAAGMPPTYGGVPVISPPAGAIGAPPRAGGGSKKGMIAVIAAAVGLVLLLSVVGLVVHFSHHEAPNPPAHHGGKHGGH